MWQYALTATVLLASIGSTTVAAPPTEEQLTRIVSIDYGGIGFSASPADLLQAFPKAKPNSDYSDFGAGVVTYEVRDDPTIDCVLLRFADEKLLEIKYFYFPTRVAAMGGPKPLNSLAVAEYGQPTSKTGNRLTWDYPNIDRTLIVSSENGYWSMRLLHRSRCEQIRDNRDISVTPQKVRIQVTEGMAVPVKRGAQESISSATVKAIVRNAQMDHPDRPSTQDYVISKHIRAHQELQEITCPQKMPTRIFKYLKAKIDRDYQNNYSTRSSRLYMLHS